MLNGLDCGWKSSSASADNYDINLPIPAARNGCAFNFRRLNRAYNGRADASEDTSPKEGPASIGSSLFKTWFSYPRRQAALPRHTRWPELQHSSYVR